MGYTDGDSQLDMTTEMIEEMPLPLPEPAPEAKEKPLPELKPADE